MRREREHPAVPVAVPGPEPRGGVLGVRFLRKPLDETRLGPLADRLTGHDVSVAGLRPGRDHAEQCDPPPRRLRHRLADRARKSRFVANDVVRGEDQKDGIVSSVAPGDRLEGGRGDRGGGIAGGRLEQNGRGGDADRRELLRDHETVRLVADHDGRPRGVQRRKPARGALQEGVLIRERDELLGTELAGERPEPASGTARQDDREYGVGHFRRKRIAATTGQGTVYPKSEAAHARYAPSPRTHVGIVGRAPREEPASDGEGATPVPGYNPRRVENDPAREPWPIGRERACIGLSAPGGTGRRDPGSRCRRPCRHQAP